MRDSTLKLLESFNILIVEDDDIARLMIKQNLSKYCKNFFEASDGLQGFEIFKKEKIDLILTDIQMPYLDGFDMMSKVLAIKPNQAFIIMTSYDNDKNILNSAKAGALNFIRKPFEIQDLQTSLLLALSKINQQNVILEKIIKLDVVNESIFVNDKPVFLSYINHKIFWLLYYNINRLVTYEMIEDYVYDNQSTSKNTIHSAILRLKKQINILNIENIANIGYFLKI